MRAFATSRGILSNPDIGNFLDAEVVKAGTGEPEPGDIAIGWGFKKNTCRIRDFAADKALSILQLEDGFLSYLTHPARGGRRMSLIADRTGVYYNARQPSDLETLLAGASDMSPELLERASQVRQRIVAARLSKYNHVPTDLPAGLRDRFHSRPCVLVVDQTAGDISIEAGLADAGSFRRMLDAAVAENPEAEILVKTHPDVLLGVKKGHFNGNLPDRCHLIGEAASPWALFELVEKVYVVSSQMGFEALMAGLPVVTFGVPFFAGWGLSDDRADSLHEVWARRDQTLSLDALVAATLIQYPLYLDVWSGEKAEIEFVLDQLEVEKAIRRPHGKTAWMIGFSVWKKSFVDAFLKDGFDQVKFISKRNAGRLEPDAADAVVIWGRREPELAARLSGFCPLWHMEDGFIRSVGLGVDLSRPASLVLDQQGVYFDATRPSDLESFLATFDFQPWHRAAGDAFLDAMKAGKVSKYNVGSQQAPDLRALADGKQIILVCGQVEGDASLRFGAGAVATNAALLEAVRVENPDAFIAYKPHPDVASGDRVGAVPTDVLAVTTDFQLEGADIHACLAQVDGLHVMTSLAGFEGLVQGLEVTVWGSPFYAGWGLTRDKTILPRRGRNLTIGELAWATYMVYPRYVNWPSGQATTAMATLTALQKARNAMASDKNLAARGGGWFRKAVNLVEAFFK